MASQGSTYPIFINGPCDDSGGGGGDPSFPNTNTTGGGGGGPFIPSTWTAGGPQYEEDEEMISDCNLLKKLSQSPDFLTKMQELKTATDGNTEISYLGNTDSNGVTTFPSNYRAEGDPNEHEVPIVIPTNKIDVIVHNHMTTTLPNVINSGSLSVHSPGDFTILQILNASNLINTQELVHIVITPWETVYALVISDSEQFNTPLTQSFLNTMEYKYRNSIQIGNTVEWNEERFLQTINELKLGFDLYKSNFNQEGSNAPFTKWSKLDFNKRKEIITKNCI